MSIKNRIIRADELYNLRDLGGLPSGERRAVKKGLVYRSDELSALTRRDLARLAELNVKTVVDFRDEGEADSSPDYLPETVERQVNLSISAGRLMGMFSDGVLTRRKSVGIMVSVYRALVQEFQPVYAEFFALLADSANTPLLFHCAAGKDRTGIAAALFLSALEVPRNLIVEDYLLSQECLAAKFRPGVDYDDAFAPLYGVQEEFIQAAFDVIDNQYDGMDSYLREKLGVDKTRFNALYTEEKQ